MPPPPYSSKGFRAFWRGFTLAEVLITLTIIGIIAALTVPTLMKNYQASQLRSAFFVANSMVKNLSTQISSDGIVFSNLTVKDISNYFKGTDLKTTGMDRIYKSFHGNYVATGAASARLVGEFKMHNGMTGLILDCSGYSCKSKYLVGFDVNGKNKKPNRYGHDTFFWHYNETSKLFEITGSLNVKDETRWQHTVCSVNPKSYEATSLCENGIGCGAKALIDANWFKNLPQ